MLHVFPDNIAGSFPRDDLTALVYYDSPVPDARVVTISSSNPAVAQPLVSSVVIEAGGQQDVFNVRFFGPGTATISVTDGVETRLIQIALADQRVTYDVYPPKPLWAHLLEGGDALVVTEIPDLAAWVASYQFSAIRWYRRYVVGSGDSQVTYLRPLTAPSAEPARIEGQNAGPWNLDGTTLHVQDQSGYTWEIQFSGPDPWDARRAAEWIRVNSGLDADVTDDGRLILMTEQSGLHTWLLIVGGSAPSIFGLDDSRKYWGRDPDTPLALPAIRYQFTDVSEPSVGDQYLYKLVTPDEDDSQFSTYRACEHRYLYDIANLCRCSLNLADLDVAPYAGRTVVFASPEGTYKISTEEELVVGQRLTRVSGDDGHVEIVLPRGILVDFWIEGTKFHRRVRVPDAEQADLADPSLAQPDDRWSVTELDIPDAILHS